MSEKSLLPSKFLFYITSISMLLIFLSSLFLFHSTYSSITSNTVFKFAFPNSTSAHLKNVNTEQFRLPFFSSDPSLTNRRSSKNLDGSICRNSCSRKSMASFEQKNTGAFDQNQASLKVFMYDLPPEFHFGLLGWKGMPNQSWPNVDNQSEIPPYPGGLNLQHSIEYWLTLDLLASTSTNIDRQRSAVRVMAAREADIIFVPFFSSLSYNRHTKPHKSGQKISMDEELQRRLVEFLMGRDEWRRSGGKDHLIVAHHPNSMLYARKMVGSAMFVLADFGRYPAEIANLEKDVIAPYMHLVKTVPDKESATFEKRPILAFFQGAIYRKDGGIIRQELYYLLKDEKDVHFSFGSLRRNGITQASRGMASSKFCLNVAGDTPSSNRLFDAIASHCIPVIISDDIELPFEDVLDYSEFSIFVNGSNAIRKGYLLNLLRGINRDQWTVMWERLKEIVKLFEYKFPSQPNDAVGMIWRAVSRKAASVRFDLHRRDRYRRSDDFHHRT